MELNLNPNHIRGHSLDEDDNFSNISRISYGLHNSRNSACNSDSECSGHVSVRDMIDLYNNQCRKEETNQMNHQIKYKINTAKRHYYRQSQHLLAATKSSYCGLNNYGSQMNCKQLADQMEDKSSSLAIDDHNLTAITCCNNCTACSCCQNRSRTNSITTKMSSSTTSPLLLLQNNENNNFNTHNGGGSSAGVAARGGVCIRSSSRNCNKINVKDTRILAVENCTNIIDETDANTNSATIKKPTILNDFCDEKLKTKDSSNNGLFNKHNSQVVVEQKKNRLPSTDSVEEANACQQQQPIETSYQSKTTIAKTSSGVRIIIDIFFDQERCANATDIVGSRVETDIPQSRILSEFQQQTMAANVCGITTTTNTNADTVAASSSYQYLVDAETS